MEQTLSNTARSERHFSAMLLPHLLLGNDYAGMRALFGSLDLCNEADVDSNDIEIVAELNPIRDIRVSPNDSKVKQRVPDLVLRIGENVLVIEAKFFTYPSKGDIVKQITSQRDAIKSVLRDTRYKRYSFHYLALTMNHKLRKTTTLGSCILHLTWQKVIDVLEPVVSEANSQDLKRVLMELKRAVKRSEEEQSVSRSQHWETCKTIQDLLQRAPELLAQGYLYVGFDRGNNKLRRSTLEDLEGLKNPRSYKYSIYQPNKNWLPMEDVLLRYLELKKKR